MMMSSQRCERPATSSPGKTVTESVVVDAAALVDVLAGTAYASAVGARLRDAVWHAPAHLDAEVLSALGRLYREGRLNSEAVGQRLSMLTSMPLRREPLPPLLPGAWARRHDLRLVDALYVELAARLKAPLITTDQRLARATSLAEAVSLDDHDNRSAAPSGPDRG